MASTYGDNMDNLSFKGSDSVRGIIQSLPTTETRQFRTRITAGRGIKYHRGSAMDLNGSMLRLSHQPILT